MAGELIVGRYRVEEEVGHGGMGVVLRAQDTRLNRAVALKMLPPHAAHESELRHRLEAEARAASALNHPGVATVYDFVEQGEDSFIVYEYIEGRTLREELARARFTIEEILDAGIQLVDALAAAHDHGITHRDLKPENIMLVPHDHFRGRVKILDFGLAKHRQPPLSAGGLEDAGQTASMQTAPGFLVGTVNYMASEQLEGQPVDARTDIYALGLVLYEMATGANPFLGKTPTSTIANILKQEPPSIRPRDPAAPAELDRILLKCLRKRPEERYQSARDILVDLQNLRRDSAESAVTSPIRESEPSLFRRFFSFIGTSPYRRWEVTHMRMCVWCPLLIYVGWRFRACTPNRWGLILFFADLVCATLLLFLLSFLLYTGAFEPSTLPREVRRMAPMIRWVTLAIVLETWTMAGTIAASHTGLAAILAFSGIILGFTVLLFKPTIDRAAFPQAFGAHEAQGDHSEGLRT